MQVEAFIFVQIPTFISGAQFAQTWNRTFAMEKTATH